MHGTSRLTNSNSTSHAPHREQARKQRRRRQPPKASSAHIVLWGPGLDQLCAKTSVLGVGY